MEDGEPVNELIPELFNRPVLECLRSNTLRQTFGRFDTMFANDPEFIRMLLIILGYQDPANRLGPHLPRYENLAIQGQMFFNPLIVELIENGHVVDLVNLRVLYDRLDQEPRFANISRLILLNQHAILRELNNPIVNQPVRRTMIYVVYHPEQIRNFPNAFDYFMRRMREQEHLEVTDINLNDVAVVNNFIDLVMPKRNGFIISFYDTFINRILHNNNNGLANGHDIVRQFYQHAYIEYLDTYVNRRFLTVIAGQFNEPEFPYPWLLMPGNENGRIRLFQGDAPNQNYQMSIDREMHQIMGLIVNAQQLQAN